MGPAQVSERCTELPALYASIDDLSRTLSTARPVRVPTLPNDPDAQHRLDEGVGSGVVRQSKRAGQPQEPPEAPRLELWGRRVQCSSASAPTTGSTAQSSVGVPECAAALTTGETDDLAARSWAPRRQAGSLGWAMPAVLSIPPTQMATVQFRSGRRRSVSGPANSASNADSPWRLTQTLVSPRGEAAAVRFSSEWKRGHVTGLVPLGIDPEIHGQGSTYSTCLWLRR